MINEKLRLSVGASPAGRVAGVVFGLIFAAFGATFAAGALTVGAFFGDEGAGFFRGDPVTCSYTDDSGFDPDGLGELPCPDGGGWTHRLFTVAHLFTLIGVLVGLLGLYLVLRALRTAAWLDGTRLRVRGAVGSRSVDLATAEVWAGVTEHRSVRDEHGHTDVLRVPTLTALDRRSGRRISLPLRAPGLGVLPPYELRALADAMTYGRPEGGGHADVHAAAAQLRTLAGNPLNL
jgi:hypothetical protein